MPKITTTTIYCLLIVASACMKLPATKLAKCVPEEYSKDYILLVKLNEERYRNSSTEVPITRNGNTSIANGTYTVSSPVVNFERQVKKYFRGKYEMWQPSSVLNDQNKKSGDSDYINYPINVYRYVFKENIKHGSKGVPVYTYNLYDRLENKDYSPVKKVGTHLFAPILNALNEKLGL
ncbi:MAG: hypothetical protein K2X48_05500 [Chitinophagaceae bacterium]|nr:hypothetical protein [Chitinophagaceae bacterium]